MKHVFLMDPLDTVDASKDTTFALMGGARRAGHDIFFLPDGGLSWRTGQLLFHTVQVQPAQELTPPFIEKSEVALSQDEVDVVWVRLNPPFNERYLINTWLLDQLPARIPVINAPSGIRTVNEKLWATQWTDHTPRTLVTNHLDHLREFLAEEREIIVKPTDGFGGMSVFHLKQGDTNAQVTLETLSHGGRREIIAQQYIPEAAQGDKRILLLDGEPLGAIMRVHSDADHRNNLCAGGRAEPAEVTPSDLNIIDALRPRLQQLGLYFVGIDVIGSYLMEVNVTSPTCLQEMSRFADQALEDKVIRFVDALQAARCDATTIGRPRDD